MAKSAIVAIILAFIQLAKSSPVAPINVATSPLTNFNRLFNERHREIDDSLRTYRMNFSFIVKNLNAQFISRFGFAITDIQHMKQQAKDAILEHALDVIGDPQNPCIVAANEEAIREAKQAAHDLSVVSELAYESLSSNQPGFNMFQVTSTSIQGTVLNMLGHSNAVVGLDDILNDLGTEYRESSYFLEFMTISLDNELYSFEVFANAVQRDVFESIDNVVRNYIHNMEQLIEEALQCS